MLLWVLSLKLWWLTLPLTTLQHPLNHEGRTVSEELEPRDEQSMYNRDFIDARIQLDPTDIPYIPIVLDSTSRKPLPATGPLPKEFLLNPLIQKYNGSGVLVNQSSNNPFTLPTRGRQPYPPDPDPYPPGPDPYPPGPDPYPPGPDPYPPADPDNWSFDWAYPPFGFSRKIIELKGNVNLKTTDSQVYLQVLGYSVGDFKGNFDDGFRIDVNIAVAKGYVLIFIVDGNPKDEVWMMADLHLPLRQHFYKKIFMFHIPHHPGPPHQVSTA
ncbi:MAG: hypothetical protein Q9209_007723 [Squamulea sp. 1 TL-2023]